MVCSKFCTDAPVRTQLWLIDLQLRVFVCYMVGAELGCDLRRLNRQSTLELVHSLPQPAASIALAAVLVALMVIVIEVGWR